MACTSCGYGTLLFLPVCTVAPPYINCEHFLSSLSFPARFAIAFHGRGMRPSGLVFKCTLLNKGCNHRIRDMVGPCARVQVTLLRANGTRKYLSPSSWLVRATLFVAPQVRCLCARTSSTDPESVLWFWLRLFFTVLRASSSKNVSCSGFPT